MSVTRSALLDDLRVFRRDVNARLDALEHKLLERSVSAPPPPRSAPSRASSPARRSPPRRPPGGRWREVSPSSRASSRTPTATKVACDACREVCWENCACSCHQGRREAAR